MNYKFLIIILFIYSCTTYQENQSKDVIFEKSYTNIGFALVSNIELKNNKVISNTIDDRALIIFQRNLKKDTKVKITNLINDKYIIAHVGSHAKYPKFYNSVISKRIFDELEMFNEEPYIKINEVDELTTFLAKKAKTYKEERNVADKAPVEGISIKDLSNNNINLEKESKKFNRAFNYIIKIADFYFEDSAEQMQKRIIEETDVKDVIIENVSKNTYRVYLGPFTKLDSLKKAFNDINQINFENIEILRK